MSGRTELVSIVMPCLDAGPYLAEAIESVRNQTYTRWELLLVDDGSADGSLDIAAEYARREPERIRVLRHTDGTTRGASGARNAALAQARGEFIAFLDADDVWLPGTLAEEVRHFAAAPGVGVVYSRALYWSSWQQGVPDTSDHAPPLVVDAGRPIAGATLLARCLYGAVPVPCTCSLLVRHDLVRQVGGFEELFVRVYTDQAFYAKLFIATDVLPIPAVLAKYRQHAKSSTHLAARDRSEKEARRAFLTWLAEYVDGVPSAPRGLRRSIQLELWRGRHPLADALLDRLISLV